MTFINNEIIKRNYLSAIPIHQALKSDAAITMQSEQEMVGYWKHELNNFYLGSQIVNRELENNPNIIEECKEKNIETEDCLIKESDLARLKDNNILEQLISGSITLQKLWNKSVSVLTIYYAIGNDLFYQKKCLEAHHVYSFLTLVNQNVPCFWIGKGAANEELENWDMALNDYWMGQTLNPHDANVYEALIRIYTKLKDDEALQECFQLLEAYPEIKMELLSEG